MDAFKFVFSAKACFKVVVRSAKTGEAIVFLVDPFYYVLPYLIVCSYDWYEQCSYVMWKTISTWLQLDISSCSYQLF